jgi:hypothetical protein
MAAMHHVVKALEANGVSFPISKADLLNKAGAAKIKTDWESFTTIGDLISNVKIDNFENKAQFFNSITAAVS